MREWFEAQLAAGLPALAGSQVTGTLAVTQELVNEFIATWLASPAVPTAAPSGARPTLDLNRFRSAVKNVAVRGEPGRILVDFDVKL